MAPWVDRSWFGTRSLSLVSGCHEARDERSMVSAIARVTISRHAEASGRTIGTASEDIADGKCGTLSRPTWIDLRPTIFHCRPVSFLTRAASAFADKVAVIDGERRYTYASCSIVAFGSLPRWPSLGSNVSIPWRSSRPTFRR